MNPRTYSKPGTNNDDTNQGQDSLPSVSSLLSPGLDSNESSADSGVHPESKAKGQFSQSSASAETDSASALDEKPTSELVDETVLQVARANQLHAHLICPFRIFDCKVSLRDAEQWKTHVMSHVGDPPCLRYATCFLCEKGFGQSLGDDPAHAWNEMLSHMAVEHFRDLGRRSTTMRIDLKLKTWMCFSGGVTLRQVDQFEQSRMIFKRFHMSRVATVLPGSARGIVNMPEASTTSPPAAVSPVANSSGVGLLLQGIPRSSTSNPSPAESGQGQSANKGELDVQKVERNLPNQAVNQGALFLLTCISIGRFATSLLQLDLKQPSAIVSDRQLLELLQARYHQARTNWHRKIFSFQTLISIEFVQFELHRKSLVDIRKRDDIPPAHRKDEYQYHPLPAEVIPPVGKNHLMHIYHHPEDADRETVCLTRFPKRIKERLAFGETDVPVGWGIEFVEGVHWNKVWCFGFAIVVSSLIAGIVWSPAKRDVQAGFGIAACMMPFLTFMVGMLQAANT